MKENKVMKTASFIGFRQWLLVGALTLGMHAGLAALNSTAFAQVIPGDPDHLKCYQVRKDQNHLDEKEVDLVNKFGLEPGCHVLTRARLFCTPVRKFIEGGDGNDPRGAALQTDFTCYNVQCPPSPNRRVAIDDQFGDRDIGIKNARMLCAPTLSQVQD
jgi:hypothetical protein